jgi:hypothetical protein
MKRLARLTVLLPTLALPAGCCLQSITGLTTGMIGTSASSAAAASSGGTTGGSGSSSGTTGGTSSGGSSGTSGGSSTGKMTVPIPTPTRLEPLVLLDAGPDVVFGPVSIAAVPGPAGEGLAKLAYSRGDGGQFGIMLQTLSADAGAIGEALEVATTGIRLEPPSDAGIQIFCPLSPPNVSVSDDGSRTAVCWEDCAAIISVSFPQPCQLTFPAPAILCGSTSEEGQLLDAGYANCGYLPTLVFNPSDGVTQLFFEGYGTILPSTGAPEEWTYGQGWQVTQVISSLGVRGVALPVAPGEDAAIWAGEGAVQGVQNLNLEQTPYVDGGYLKTASTNIDSRYKAVFNQPAPFAAAGSTPGQVVGVLVTDATGLIEFTVELDGGVFIGQQHPLSSAEPLTGAVAVGACPGGFVYFATTADDQVLITRGNFDGTLVADGGQYFDLVDFNQTPGLYWLDSTNWGVPATSLAVAPASGNNLFLAISNPAQVAVYVVSCE